MKGMKEPSDSLFIKLSATDYEKQERESIFRSCPLNTVQKKLEQ